MKYSELLAKLLIDPELRKGSTSICTYMWGSMGGDYWVIPPEALRSWPEWNGTRAYPIEGYGLAWNRSRCDGTFWRGKLGQRRRSLLRHLIRYYRERGQ